MNDRAAAPLGFIASFARLIAAHVRACEHDHRPVLALLGLPEDDGKGPAWVTAQQITDALHVAAHLCQDPHIGLTIGQQVRPATMGALGYALISCTELEDGLAMFERLQSMVCTQVRAEHRLKGDCLESTLLTLGGVPDDTHLWSFAMVSRLAFSRWVLGRHLVPLELWMPCPAPADLGPLQHFVGAPIVFNAPFARERLPAAWLSLPNPNADAGLHRVMNALTQQQWAQLAQTSDNLLALLRQKITQGIQQGVLPLLDQLAPEVEAALGLSSRQLQRRLAEQGLSFKDMVEQVRREQVLHELRDTQLPMADIARRAAYAEVSSMHRAVRRWTGLTPLAVRQGQAPQDDALSP
jgi:AraC-like DNA-binding protein